VYKWKPLTLIVKTIKITKTTCFPQCLTLHLNTARSMNTLASSVRAQRRSGLDESSGNLNRHTSSVQRSHADADVLHALSGDVGSSGLQRGPAVAVVSYVLVAIGGIQ
jgi:hypothetical protein